jgi:cytochrome P450
MPLRAHVFGNPGQGDAGGMPYGAFDPDYVRNAIQPFLRTSIFVAPPLTLPMIETTFSKELAIPPHFWGALYRDWRPSPDEVGTSVFIQGLENRGEDNARKRIYMSATTPDLYLAHYRPKVRRFFENLFDAAHAGEPLMRHYYDNYFDMYWDLHVGVRDDDLPEEMREIGLSFTNIIGFWDPRREFVYDSYMRVRELHPGLTDWLDDRIQDVIDGNIDAPEATFVHYWTTNGELGPNFRREDVVFECFHNFLAFSQFAQMTYRIMEVFQQEGSEEREWLRRTMEGDPDAVEEGGFSPLDRYVMELFRTISPNGGSLSTLAEQEEGVTGTDFVLHPHPASNRAPRHWTNPDAFDPDRYRDVVTASDVDDGRCEEMGLARCPFGAAPFEVRDPRPVVLPSSGFGTVHAVIDGTPAPLADTAGYAPFGFGYRRCAGEWFTVEVFKDLLRHVHEENIVFERVDVEDPDQLPAGPVTVIEDDIVFRRA